MHLTVEDGWLAGMIEGEACIDLNRATAESGRSHRLRVRIKMVDEDVVRRIAELWGASYWRRPSTNDRWADQFETTITGQRAESVCRRLWPLLGSRRREQIEESLAEVDRKRPRQLART